jgi:cytochrome c biogenesis factor
MNNIIISLIIAAISTFILVITEAKKENRISVGIRAFITIFIVSFVALTYLITEKICHDIETGDPNF